MKQNTQNNDDNNSNKETKVTDAEKRLGLGGGAKWVKGVKGNKFPVIKKINHRDTVYSVVTKVNNTVLHI